MDRIIVKVTSPPYKYKMLVINTTDKTFRKANIKVLSGDKEATTECLEERKPVFEIMDGGSYTIKGKRKIMSYKQRYHHNCRKSSKKNKSYRITQKLRQHNSR